MLAEALLGFVQGPVFSIIDKLIPDPDLKAKLKVELQTSQLNYQDKFTSNQKDVVISETSGSIITRTWRPVLMYVIIFMLVFFGLALPSAELWMGSEINFNPHWKDIPDGLWNLLSLGVGGYIGGRSLEKIATTVSLPEKVKRFRKGIVRKNNFNTPQH